MYGNSQRHLETFRDIWQYPKSIGDPGIIESPVAKIRFPLRCLRPSLLCWTFFPFLIFRPSLCLASRKNVGQRRFLPTHGRLPKTNGPPRQLFLSPLPLTFSLLYFWAAAAHCRSLNHRKKKKCIEGYLSLFLLLGPCLPHAFSLPRIFIRLLFSFSIHFIICVLLFALLCHTFFRAAA